MARPILARSGVLLADTASMMIVTDAAGLIIEIAGDPHTMEQGRRNHLETGGHWAEGSIGTNAIGTALSEKRAVQILGAEHFCEDVQRWSCAATPVHHPRDGELLGVIDISGPVTGFNRQNLALAVGIGKEIELSLDRLTRQKHEELLRHFVSKRALWLKDEILALDSHGLLVHGTPKALKFLEAQETTHKMLRDIMRGIPSELWEKQIRQHLPNANLEVVEGEDGALGCLIITHHARPQQRGSWSHPRQAAKEEVLDFTAILGDSPAIATARERARKLAASKLPVLIEGETGVGKELFARAIHASGPLAAGPFIPVNCGGVAKELIASELFGYAKGSFTGADEAGRTGKIEAANHGVLCLDEIGEMPLDLQSYLLRVLEDQVVYRVGEHEGRPVDICVISMTNRDLSDEVKGGRFRRDLYYRIAVARLRVPPLRERGGDILLLAQHFASRAAIRLGRQAPSLNPRARDVLMAYGWPGNVRELRNAMEIAVTLAESGLITPEELPEDILAVTPSSPPAASVLRDAERETIMAHIEACGGNLSEAARRLGIARSTLYLRLSRYRAR
ncbi:sigma-54-dependent Fis family transcriptional regulator [Acidocella sp.]|uniref:sigma-54-dependent Fis family transcriptional regulator n=1 Tax=Acidocella sp. TaxID=50710 RepID=UPI003CFC349A